MENSQGIITADYKMDPTEPRLANDPEYIQWRAWFDKYLPSANPADAGNVTGWAVAALRRFGDELTRENVMR